MKFLNHNLFTGDITVNGTTTLSTATGITRPTGDNTTHLATTEFVKAQGYATTAALSGYVPITRTITINGTTLDLSADRTWTIASGDYTSKVQHQVKAGVAINKGQAVYVTTSDGTNMIVGLASNATEATSSKTMGLLDATVAQNGFANVVTEGLLAGLNTVGATAGDPVWLGTGGNLIYGLLNKPYAPAHLVFIGIVTRVNANNGEIFVKVQNGFELNEIHDIDLKTTVPVNGHILGFDGTLWVNKTIATWLGYTPANASGTTNYLSKFTGSTTLGNSLVYDNGTNVGIGTTSPAYKLDVNGNTRSEGVIIGADQTYGDPYRVVAFGGNQNGYNRIFASTSSSDGMYFAAATGQGFNFRPNGTTVNQVVINSSGYVGVGTDSPTKRLHVISGDNEGIFMQGSSNGGHWFDFKSANSNHWSMGAQPGLMGWYNRTDSSYKMVITDGGNVGIGTTSPGYKLSVDSVSQSTIAKFYTSDNNYSTIEVGDTGDVYSSVYLASNSGNGQIYKYGSGWGAESGMLSLYSSNGPIALQAGGSTKVFVTALGSVGIGTASPTNKLQLANGDMSITSGYSFILADTDTNWRLGRNIIVENGNQLTANTMQFVAANAANEGWQFVDDDGNTRFEIGASTGNAWLPSGNLYLNGNLAATQAWVTGQGYLTSYTETDTLASVTGRGATTSVNNVQFNDGVTLRRNVASGPNVHTYVINSGGGYSSAIYIGANPGADWLIGKDAYGAGNDKFQIGSWNGYSYIDITYNTTAGTINFPNNGGLTVNNNTIWHAGNDGSGSGLDADLLDGQHGSYYQPASTAITTSNIGSQSVAYASEAGFVSNQGGQLLRFDNRIISPSETNAGYLQFGFTSWANNNTGVWADYLHLRSYTDGSGGNDNLVMFKKDGIGMRIWQQSWGSSTAYSSYADVWTSGDFTSTNVSNWNTAYGWGNHASAGYIVQGTQILSSPSWTTATRFGSVGDISQAAGNHALSVRSEDGNDAFMSFHIGNDYAVHFGLERTSNRMYVGGWSDGTGNKYQIWDSRDFSSTNISNWNTAYSWGNHATAGYLTAESDTLQTVTNRGATTTNPVFINSGAGYPLRVSSGQRYMMQIRNTANTVDTNYGWWWFMDTDFNMGFHADAAGDKFTLTRSGDATASSSFRAPIFYDSDDTTYYLDPNSTSRSFRGRGEILLGPNTSGEYTRLGGNGGSVDYATLSASNGNLHIDCKDGYGLYLNYYSRDTIYLGQSGAITSDGSYYNGTSASAGNSDTLDSYHETSFVRLAVNSSSPTNGNFAIGNASSRNFIQSHSGQPLDINPLGNEVTVGSNLIVSGHGTLSGALKDSSNVRMFMPGGGSYVTQTSVVNGAIRIKLPTQGSAMMMSCTVKVYEYSTGKSFTITFGGHRDGANWYNEFCYIDGDQNRGNLTVRFGVSGGKDCVWIGETSSSWSYPQVFVTDFQLGYTGYSAAWATGWEIAFVTAFDTINRTQTAYAKITNANIGSQSVSYATSAGSASSATTSSNVTVNSGNGSAAWYPIVWHSGNTLYSSSGTTEIYPAGGYIRSAYINTTDNDETGITRFVIKNGDNYHRSATTTTAATIIRGVASGTWGIDISGNAATASTFSTGRTNYKGVTDGAVAGQLMWKNYGNNHTIFDASNSTSPSGTSVNNTNSQVAWTGTYPTLMGWNGSETYGVRVDSARIADYSSASITSPAGNNQNYHLTFVASSAASTQVIRTDDNANVTYNPATGTLTSPSFSGTFSGTFTGNASTARVVTIQDTPPTGSPGRLWWESDTGKLKVYYGTADAWVDASPIPDMSLYYQKAGGVITGDVTIQQTLTVVGNTLIQGILTETSDISLKENILPLESSLEKVMQLKGVSFNKIETPKLKEIGFIAQEVESVIPELVTETEDGIKTVSYSRVTAVLVETVKEQQAQIDELKELVLKLSEKLNNL